MKGPWILALLPLLLTVSPVLAADPAALQVIPGDDGRSVEIVDGAGARISGPFPVRAGAEAELLRPRTEAPLSPDSFPGSRVLWSDGTHLLLEIERETAGPARSLRATVFDPAIADLVAQVDSVAYFPWIRRLAGADPVTVGGQPHTFTTRNTYNAQCDLAEQYVYERFLAMGLTDVAYHAFDVQGHAARNVVATLPGEETPEEIYILCGHLDSVGSAGIAPGANDNASGTAAVLAAAEILSGYGFRSTIRFVAFTGEEQGLFGSQNYVIDAIAAGDSILGAVNCDMVAWYNTRYQIDIEGESFADPLMQVMNDACQTYTGLDTRLLYNAWGSDHVSFLNRGVPAFLAIERDWASYPCYHSACDTAEANDAAFGVEVTRACLATIAHLAEVLGPVDAPVGAAAPASLALEVRPNPFGASAAAQFALPRAAQVRLTVHDVSGRRVRTLLDDRRGPGAHVRSWDGMSDSGAPAPSGIYFFRVAADGRVETAKTVRLR